MANNGGGNQPEQESLWDRISRGLVVDFATAIAAFYAIGLLIVNLDLGRYGLVAVDLARPEYVVVGLLWTILVTLTIAAIWFVTWLVLDVTWPSALFKPFVGPQDFWPWSWSFLRSLHFTYLSWESYPVAVSRIFFALGS